MQSTEVHSLLLTHFESGLLTYGKEWITLLNEGHPWIDGYKIKQTRQK